MAEYKITIDGTGALGGSGGGTASNGGGATDMGGLAEAYGTYKAIKGFAPVAAAASVAKDIFAWQISLVGRNTGNALVQQKIDAGMQIAGQAIGIGGTFIAGLITGNPLLLVGAIAGAAKIGIGYAREQEQLNYERRWENIGIALATERAGASLNRSRMQ